MTILDIFAFRRRAVRCCGHAGVAALGRLAGVAAVLGLGTLTSCSSGSPALARVGNKVITVADFKEVAARTGPIYAIAPDSAKRLLLDDLVKRALLLEAARREPYGQERELADFRRKTESEVLSAAMVERLVPRSVPVSEAEVRVLHGRLGQEGHLQVILVMDASSARAAAAELARGTPFAGVADRFNPPGMLPPGGDLGFVTSGRLPPPLEDWVTQAPLGKIMGPVYSPDESWYIARVVERRPRQREPLEVVQPQLTQTLIQRKRRLLSMRTFQKLREGYRLRVAEGAPQLLFARFNRPPEDTLPDTQDPTIVLARYETVQGRDTTYKLRDALDDLDAANADRPDPHMMPSIEQWIQSRVMQRIVVFEARRRHLDEEPAIARRIRQRVEDYLLQAVYEDQVARVQATPADLVVAFQHQAHTLARLISVRVQHLTLPDSGSAARTLEHASGAPSLRDAILLSSAGFQVKEETVHFPSSDPDWAPLEQALKGAAPGTYGGPVRVKDGWRVIQILSAERTTPTLESLPPQSQQMVRLEAENLARERRLSEYLASLRRTVPVSVDLERLKRVPWPAPANGVVG